MRSDIRRMLENLTGFRIYKQPPRGADIFFDIARDLPHLEIKTVFDVGANIGQSAREYLRAFPGASISCFEPVASTFAQLTTNLRGEPSVKTYQLAFGANVGTETMSLEGPTSMFRLTAVAEAKGLVATASKSEQVQVDTLDAFCAAHNVSRINYLKVDTEGADLAVLEGAAELLTGAAIDLIQVETGIGIGEAWHVPLREIQEYMATKRYQIFSLTEQHRSFTPPRPYLARLDAVFISEELAEGGTATN